MGAFSKKALWIVIVFLLIINLALVGFVFFGRGGGPKKDNMRLGDYLKTELKMTEDQASFFQKSVEHLREKNHRIGEQRRDLKRSILTQFGEPAKADSIMRILSDLEYQTERAVFDHFQEVRNNLSTDQAREFDNIIVEAHKKFGPKGPKGPRPGGRGGRR